MKEMSKISECRSCGAAKLQRFFDLGKQPLANSLKESAAGKEKAYDLSLSYCRTCSLVQLNETVRPEIMFTDYPWVTGTSQAARDFADVFARAALKKISKKDPFVLEIASNDGTFLVPYIRRGIRALGVDPARNIEPIARAAGVQTVVNFFGKRTARTIVTEHGKVDLVIARNVLYHLADLSGVMAGISDVLADGGVLAAEFHYGGKMLRELHYDTVYHEHVCYYTLKSFEKLLNLHGLRGFDISWSPINSGGLIVYASVEKRPRSARYLRLEEQEKRQGVNLLSEWKKFALRSEDHRDRFTKTLSNLKRQGKRVVGYGASARSSTLLNFCAATNDDIVEIADANPLKHGRFTAGSSIPIREPRDVFASKPDVVVLLAWNFAQEIMNQAKERFGYSGVYLVPLPYKPKII